MLSVRALVCGAGSGQQRYPWNHLTIEEHHNGDLIVSATKGGNASWQPATHKRPGIAESIGVCFLSTGDSRYPMAALVRKEEEAIYFLTDARSEKIAEISNGKSDKVGLGYSVVAQWRDGIAK
jgi:hypothetical protein